MQDSARCTMYFSCTLSIRVVKPLATANVFLHVIVPTQRPNVQNTACVTYTTVAVAVRAQSAYSTLWPSNQQLLIKCGIDLYGTFLQSSYQRVHIAMPFLYRIVQSPVQTGARSHLPGTHHPVSTTSSLSPSHTSSLQPVPVSQLPGTAWVYGEGTDCCQERRSGKRVGFGGVGAWRAASSVALESNCNGLAFVQGLREASDN